MLVPGLTRPDRRLLDAIEQRADRGVPDAVRYAMALESLDWEQHWDRIAESGAPIVAKCGYSSTTAAAVALAAATAKTVLAHRAAATFGLEWIKGGIYFDGVTASAIPVLVEFCLCTFASGVPGTNSTSVTPVQTYGKTIAHGQTAARDWSTAPTVLSVSQERLITPNAGVWEWENMVGRAPDSGLSEGFAIRCTAPAIVNCRAGIDVERI
jgi:hypothetical protein